MANVYLHGFDKFFHQADGPAHFAKAKLVRYADDFVVLARYQGPQLQAWIETTLEKRMGLKIKRPFRPPEGTSYYQHLLDLGLVLPQLGRPLLVYA